MTALAKEFPADPEAHGGRMEVKSVEGEGTEFTVWLPQEQRGGARKDIQVDARIVAATNSDIGQAIVTGSFREDLYYRIRVISIHLPPLRQRGEDVILLATLFLRRLGEAFGKRVHGFSVSALEAMREYAWPGNVRELENKVKRAVIMADGPMLEAVELCLSSAATGASEVSGRVGVTMREARDKVEREMLALVLERQEGNVVRAAEELRVSRPTLYDLMKKHKLHNPAG